MIAWKWRPVWLESGLPHVLRLLAWRRTVTGLVGSGRVKAVVEIQGRGWIEEVEVLGRAVEGRVQEMLRVGWVSRREGWTMRREGVSGEA